MLFVYEKPVEGGGSDFVVISSPDAARAAAVGRDDGMVGAVAEFDDDWLNDYYSGAATLSTRGF